jgi:hypothetical protein
MLEHAALFRQCLIDLDVAMMRQLWWHISPHLPQPHTDAECIETMHLARIQMTTLPKEMREYSEAWVAEHKVSRDVFAVGIAVMSASSADPHKRRRGIYVQQEMAYSVEQSLAWGTGLEDPKDAAEVKRRMMMARERA